MKTEMKKSLRKSELERKKLEVYYSDFKTVQY